MTNINVIAEYKDGTVIQYEVTEDDWFEYVQRNLENDDNCVHYTAEAI